LSRGMMNAPRRSRQGWVTAVPIGGLPIGAGDAQHPPSARGAAAERRVTSIGDSSRRRWSRPSSAIVRKATSIGRLVVDPAIQPQSRRCPQRPGEGFDPRPASPHYARSNQGSPVNRRELPTISRRSAPASTNCAASVSRARRIGMLGSAKRHSSRGESDANAAANGWTVRHRPGSRRFSSKRLARNRTKEKRDADRRFTDSHLERRPRCRRITGRSDYSKEDALKEMARRGRRRGPPPTLDARRGDEHAVGRGVKAVRQVCILGNFDLTAPNALEIVKNWRQRRHVGLPLHVQTRISRRGGPNGSLDWFGGWRIGEAAGGVLARPHGGARRHRPAHPRSCCTSTIRTGGGGGADRRMPLGNLGGMLALPNIPMSRSSFRRAELFDEPYPYRNIHKYIRQISTRSAPSACFWGTDITRMPCSYRNALTMFRGAAVARRE